MWDAAYVLGSLPAADRREFEAHLADCPACWEAVTEISDMPALLSQLNHNDVATITGAGQTTGAPASARRRHRRTPLVTWTATAAAAVVLALGVFIGIAGHSPMSPPPPATPSALPMTQVGTTALVSTVSVSSQRWGTVIDMNCVCLAPVYAPHDTLAMVVVGRDGSQTRLATWVAEPGHTASPAGSISTPVDQIASVQVVYADNGKVLLERTL